MALSYYSNWEAMDHILTINSNLTQFNDQPSELTDALIGLYDPIDFSVDSLFDSPPNDLLDYTETATTASNLIPSFSDPSIISLPTDNLNLYRCPKRPRSCNDIAFETNPYNAPLAQGNSYDGEKKMHGGPLSTQSAAARERRKRISEKTQELGRLIPGGNKMNTAEMFQAAFKYVKFLQAQVGILGLTGSVQGGDGSPEAVEDMQVMLRSPVIQEKLYGEGWCIVPKETVHALAMDGEIKSSPSICKNLDRLIESTTTKSVGR